MYLSGSFKPKILFGLIRRSVKVIIYSIIKTQILNINQFIAQKNDLKQKTFILKSFHNNILQEVLIPVRKVEF